MTGKVQPKNEDGIKVEEFADTGGSELKCLNWAFKLDKLGVEVRGIERIPPEERDAYVRKSKFSRVKQFIDVIGLWVAACGGLTSMSSFFLPALSYNLTYRDSLISGLISMHLGCVVPAFCSIMGAKSGCRQIVSAKFLFGTWGIKAIAVLVIVSGVGWSVINCVLGGQLLASMSSVPLVTGIIIISLISFFVAVFGIRILLIFQNLLAIPMVITIILFYILVCKKIDYVEKTDLALSANDVSSSTNRGNWLSFFTIGYSVTSTWGAGASDYYILFPESTPAWQLFCLTYLGISIPTTFVAVVSIICGNIAYSYKPWKDAYDLNGVGGLLNEACRPWGNFGKFLVVLFYLSLVCNNIMNTYSCGLEFQLLHSWFINIPRWMWVTLTTVIYLVISLAGREHLSTIIANFLPMLGYWISMYITLLIEETVIFRWSKSMRRLHYKEFGSDNEILDDNTYLYNWEEWNNSSSITFGIAAVCSFVVGIAGAVVGMNQVYWRGPLARLVGDNGADIGFWLCIAFTGVVYPFFRFFELKYLGK
ncbi:Piso0_000012 [Millerozyma farinosa CBS 7064]|uniref:Piso0_000012 protein n=1 Tax=Pichia sorbitophila (strain ATCC MYA-4447 / BCRC 22081 / CBS 7064 / NBRC 10061 / NRRL Y-12695) TaxID=559304 RepID=G8YUB1_PICSO|nr:Piso0_000012 [Millerozyma farinosa CBS 7064]